MSDPPAGSPPPPWSGSGSPPPPPPPVSSAEQVRLAYQRRHESDYIFGFWSALLWTLLTCGVFGIYVFYQLMRRMRDHNRRRLELLDATVTFAWEQAVARGLDDGLRPTFERMATNIATLRRLTTEFREPVVWAILHVVAGVIADFIAFYFLDNDLINHDSAESAVEADLSEVFGRLGQPIPSPDPAGVKGKHNYAGRIAATIFSFGLYLLWWYNDMFREPNTHFEADWAWEDSLAAAVYELSV